MRDPKIQNGKLYLSQTFLSFASLDKKGCRLALALYTIRRVEKVAALDGLGLGAFALSLTLFHGARIVRLHSSGSSYDAVGVRFADHCAVLIAL